MDVLGFFPLILMVVGYICISIYKKYKYRRHFSVMGVSVLESYLKVLNIVEQYSKQTAINEVSAMKQYFMNWSSINNFPHQTLERIQAVSENTSKLKQTPNYLYMAMKDYIGYVETNWELIRTGSANDFKTKTDTIRREIKECKDRLANNAASDFPS